MNGMSATRELLDEIEVIKQARAVIRGRLQQLGEKVELSHVELQEEFALASDLERAGDMLEVRSFLVGCYDLWAVDLS
jgi:hypothetical protein